MLLTMLHSKLHRAKVTHAELHYNGSLGVDTELMEQAGMIPGQRIDVLNVNNGERFTTYLIAEPAGSHNIGVYGAAAHKVNVGDLVIIIAYALMDQAEARSYKPRTLIMQPDNTVAEVLQ